MNPRMVPLLALLGAVLIGALWWFLLYGPAREDRQVVEAEITQLQSRQTQLQSEIARLREIESNEVELQSKLRLLEEYIPSAVAQPAVLRQMQIAADAAGLEIVSAAFAEPIPVQDAPDTGIPDTALASIPVTMVLEGGYFQVADFFRRLEVDTRRAVLVTDFAMTEEGQAGFPTLSTSWSGSLFSVVPVVPGEPPPPDPNAEADPEDADADANDADADDADIEVDVDAEISRSGEEAAVHA